MKTNISIIIVISVLSLFLGSCRARFYTPNRNPIPFFKAKGDVFIDASTNVFNKYDLTLGYALTNALGAYVGYAGASQKGDFSDTFKYSKYKYSGDMLNLGFGYFLNQNIAEHFRFEVFGDYGMGTYKNSVVGDKNQYFNGKYQRIGIMPNIGYSSENFSMAYSVRLSQLSFSNASFSDSAVWSDDINRLSSKDYYTMLEQCIQFRMGFEHIKFQAQIGAYSALNATEEKNAVPQFNASFIVGVAINTNILGNGD